MANENKIKILIAEDDEPTRMLLRASIVHWGFEVIEAADGEEAWEILTQDHPPQILLLDWLMPRLDGIGLCKRIREKYDGLHPYIIFLTNLSSESDVLKGIEAGAEAYIFKPFNVSELRARLNAAVRYVEHRGLWYDECIQLKSTCMHVLKIIDQLKEDPNISSKPEFQKLDQLVDKYRHEK